MHPYAAFLLSRSFLLTSLGASTLFGGEFDAIKGSLDKLRKNQPSAAEEIKTDSSAMRLIKQRVDPITSPWKVKLLASEWLLRAHLLRSRLKPEEAMNMDLLGRAWDLVSIAASQSRDLSGHGVAIDLYRGSDATKRAASAAKLGDSLNTEEIPAEVQEALTWLCVEVPCRLGDPVKMKQGLLTFQLKPSKDSRAQTFAMMAAFHAGEWALAGQLGKTLNTQASLFQALHEQSIQDPKTFDYTALLLWVDKLHPASPYKGELQIKEYPFKQFRFRLKDVEGRDIAKVTKAKSEIPPTWQTPQSTGFVRISGAVAHWFMPFGNQTPMSGALTPDKLSLLGYAEDKTGRYLDTLELQRDASRENLWTGSLINRTPESEGLTYVFDVEAELLMAQR